MAKRSLKRPDRVRKCHCVLERGGKHVYQTCFRSKNVAQSAAKRMRKAHPKSKFWLRSGFCRASEIKRS